MSGINFHGDFTDIEKLQQRLAKFQHTDTEALLDGLGAMIVDQTVVRIADEKTDPEGNPWAELSESYSARKKGSGGILEGEGDLRDSIQHVVDGDEVAIGTPLIYGAIHQLGGTEDMRPQNAAIEARAFIGLSIENVADLQDFLDDWLADEVSEVIH